MAELSLGLSRYGAPIAGAAAIFAAAVVGGFIWVYSVISDQAHQKMLQNASAQLNRCGYEVIQLVPTHYLVTGQDGRAVALLPDKSLDTVVLLSEQRAGPGDTLIGMSDGSISMNMAGALDAANFGGESRYPNSSTLSIGSPYLVAAGVVDRGVLCPQDGQQ